MRYLLLCQLFCRVIAKKRSSSYDHDLMDYYLVYYQYVS